MKDMVYMEDFVKEFAEYSRMSQKDISYLFKSLDSFMKVAIENQCSIRTPIFELYYSDMKGRDTKLFGKLPPTRKAKLRLANKHRRGQSSQSKIYRTVLEKTEVDETLTDYE